MHPIRRFCSRGLLLLAAAFSLLPRQTFASTPEQVDAALERAKVYLYSVQNNGLWETHPAKPTAEEVAAEGHTVTGGQWGGETALVVYALLAAGESPTDPRLAPAIKFLRTADIKGVYALGLRAQLYNFLPPSKEVKQEASEDLKRFEGAIFTDGHAKGLFDYLLDSKRDNRFDHSVSQYGVLGTWACERTGVEVPSSFWQIMEDAWNRDQQADGSWCYGRAPAAEKGETMSMTVAGVATLFITQDYIHQTNGLKCSGNIVNPHIDAGLKWIGENFEHLFTDKSANSPYYALYGVERVGVASGRKYLGKINWYDRGADFLVRDQARTGGWGGVVHTSFAMLFLARGRAPVIFNKLQYDSAGKEGNWNERPRDIANLTHWIAKNTERDLNWQIVNLNGSVSELLDAPVLYISGNQELEFSSKQIATLRDYCEAGGLIMGNPDCNSSAFSDSFRKLGQQMFRNDEFRNVPKNSPIFTNEQYPRTLWKPPPTMLGISNGVRELMLLTNNSDPARSWQTEETNRNPSDFQLTDDVVLYAIDKNNLLEKGKTFLVNLDPAISTNRTIKLARLQWPGNWDPEPGGWRRMRAILHNKSRIDLQISIAKLGSNQLGDGKSGANVATLTGTGEMKLAAPQRQELKDYISGGGTLIVDAAGGDNEFAQSVETELQAIFGPEAGAQLKAPLPPSADIYNLPGNIIKTFTYRSYARTTLGALHGPQLCAATIDKRPAIYYSRLDLSGGLVGQPTDGIIGYDPAIATAIMTNLVITGGLGGHAPVTPTTK